MESKPVILWFRRDLRLADNPAVDAAVRLRCPVIPVFVLDERDGHCWDNGAATRWWLHGSLAALNERLGELGGRLILRRGDATRELGALVDESGAGHLFFSSLVGAARRLERAVEQRLGDRVDLQAFPGHTLHEPGSVRTTADEPYKVFTPFWRACGGLPDPAEPLAAPGTMRFSERQLHTDELSDWTLRPSSPDWAGGLRDSWTPGEEGALARSREVFYVKRHDSDDPDRPDRAAT
jgi:deoxyribodipyrimidine photo-lyase